jgi:hypothetical protein
MTDPLAAGFMRCRARRDVNQTGSFLTKVQAPRDCAYRLSTPVMAVLGLDPRIDPAISHPPQIANDAIPVSNHPTKMIGSSPVMTDWIIGWGKGAWY